METGRNDFQKMSKCPIHFIPTQVRQELNTELDEVKKIQGVLASFKTIAEKTHERPEKKIVHHSSPPEPKPPPPAPQQPAPISKKDPGYDPDVWGPPPPKPKLLAEKSNFFKLKYVIVCKIQSTASETFRGSSSQGPK